MPVLRGDLVGLDEGGSNPYLGEADGKSVRVDGASVTGACVGGRVGSEVVGLKVGDGQEIVPVPMLTKIESGAELPLECLISQTWK
mmetsp:Transcript_25883/g.71260  ORF Transcript_25883/g.71260 Transcript_25883/m.71260 type:complete len:86 (-) Transcript_25883:504-761(-)